MVEVCFSMDHINRIMKALLSIAFSFHQVSAATHTLHYIYTAVITGKNSPELSAVGLVDGDQFMYYDSNISKYIPKTEWIKKIDDHDLYWIKQRTHEIFQDNLREDYISPIKGVHRVQVMYGCELDDDATKRGYIQYGYDGEDYISLDMNTKTWTASNDKALFTKLKWDLNGVENVYYLENTCIERLQKYVSNGRDTLERKVPPEVSVYQKGSSSAVCHATGFFPKAVMISWQKDGEDLHENVELTETLPNHDGSFQKRSILTVSPEELKNHKYTCVVQHSGLERDVVTPFYPGGGSVGVIVGVVVSVLLLVLIGCVGFFIWRKKKKNDFKPVSADSNTSSAGKSSITISSETLENSKSSNLSRTSSESSTSSDDSVTSRSTLIKKNHVSCLILGYLPDSALASRPWTALTTAPTLLLCTCHTSLCSSCGLLYRVIQIKNVLFRIRIPLSVFYTLHHKCKSDLIVVIKILRKSAK
ncbi:BOLA class I histocompatibility antigen, alpha chain BL3-7-like isoform X2 [Brachyhypopomus gauderio]|uniref:BOLA class I histocompatibility antigen, alpha chain BL3-7-like isoform X2 n=1 Tax=Brachyhypopomus gauderio TaxID=698409 RepID=UPI004041D786